MHGLVDRFAATFEEHPVMDERGDIKVNASGSGAILEKLCDVASSVPVPLIIHRESKRRLCLRSFGQHQLPHCSVAKDVFVKWMRCLYIDLRECKVEEVSARYCDVQGQGKAEATCRHFQSVRIRADGSHAKSDFPGIQEGQRQCSGDEQKGQSDCHNDTSGKAFLKPFHREMHVMDNK